VLTTFLDFQSRAGGPIGLRPSTFYRGLPSGISDSPDAVRALQHDYDHSGRHDDGRQPVGDVEDQRHGDPGRYAEHQDDETEPSGRTVEASSTLTEHPPPEAKPIKHLGILPGAAKVPGSGSA